MNIDDFPGWKKYTGRKQCQWCGCTKTPATSQCKATRSSGMLYLHCMCIPAWQAWRRRCYADERLAAEERLQIEYRESLWLIDMYSTSPVSTPEKRAIISDKIEKTIHIIAQIKVDIEIMTEHDRKAFGRTEPFYSGH